MPTLYNNDYLARIVLSEVVKSPVETHTVMLVTGEGFVLDTKCYPHPTE